MGWVSKRSDLDLPNQAHRMRLLFHWIAKPERAGLPLRPVRAERTKRRMNEECRMKNFCLLPSAFPCRPSCRNRCASGRTTAWSFVLWLRKRSWVKPGSFTTPFYDRMSRRDRIENESDPPTLQILRLLFIGSAIQDSRAAALRAATRPSLHSWSVTVSWNFRISPFSPLSSASLNLIATRGCWLSRPVSRYGRS